MAIDPLAQVITIDGPGASGKGTIAKRLAQYLHWHLLDSGSIYRAFAWGFLHDQLPLELSSYQTVITRLRLDTPLECGLHDLRLYYAEQLIDDAIRAESCAQMASKLGSIAAVREVLLPLQRQARRAPGLVADGRDMGTVIFPDALIKFYLDADPEHRAQRRYNQLKQQGINVSLDAVKQDLAQRDYRDINRPISPTQPVKGMVWIDTTHLLIDQVFLQVVAHVNVLIKNIG